MARVDEAVLGDPGRLAAVDRARRVAPRSLMSLDGTARLAARLLGAPMGVVTFVGEKEEHFAGAYGLPLPLVSQRQALMAYSVCKYVVSADHPVWVGDMRADDEAELREHPLVEEYGIRSFIGVPLHDAADHPVGALSVLDTGPRSWTDEQLCTLVEIAGLLAPVPVPAEEVATTVVGALDGALLLEQVQEAFVTVDVSGVVVGWNPAARDMFGYTADEICGRGIDETILPDYDGHPTVQALSWLLAEPPAQRAPRRVSMRHRDGRRLPVGLVLSVVWGVGGALVCALITDISGQIAAEHDAERQRSLLAALLDSLDTGVFAVDGDGNTILVNRALRQLHHLSDDWTPADVDEAVAGSLFQTDGRPMPWHRMPISRALNGEYVRDAGVVIQPPGARARSFMANAQPITTDDDRHLGAVVALHEVTALRRGERFRDCERRVLQSLAHAHDAADAGPAVLEAVATTLGWPHAELWLVDEVTGTLEAAAHWTAPTMQVDDLLGAKVIKGVGITGTVWATGEPLWVPDVADTEHLTTADAIARAEACARRGLHTVLAVPVGDGQQVHGVLTCFADTPEYDETELTNHLGGMAAQIGRFLATCRAKELSVQLERSKDDFITLVGHEMRTPLTSIAAYTDLLLTAAEHRSVEDRQLLEVIARNTSTLRAIIDDLLELAGLESGHLGIAVREMDLTELVRYACAQSSTAAVSAGLTLQLDVPERMLIEGDPDRLREVVDNLLSNAVKYSPDGGNVQVRLSQQHGVVELAITDTGIGIPPDERDQLFRRFYRASNARDRGIPGTGLGLPIVRSIVEAHHGSVTMTAHDPGTTVVIRLPRSAHERDAVPQH